MRALTLTQPWASLVAIGAKQIETRSWPPPKWLIGQRLAIHAGKGLAGMTEREFQALCLREPFCTALVGARLAQLIPLTFPSDLPRGVIMATVVLKFTWSTDDVPFERISDQERAFGNYSPRRWMWVFDALERIDPPIPARGSQGLWEWQPEAK